MPHVQIDAYIVMPNHLHGILSIGQDLSRYETRQFGSSQAGQLSSVIAAYKAAVTRSVNREVKEPGGKIWQRGYYEKIVRTKDAYERIHAYIYENPEQWAEDEENPARRLPKIAECFVSRFEGMI